jgi:hypothetical protein
MKRKPSKPWMVGLAAVEVVAAIFAWRDLDRRSDAEVRGAKRTWRTVIALNPGNSLFYWAFGRR